MPKEIWRIIEVSESVLDPEEGITEKETLITICPLNRDWQSESETFSLPLKEKDFWESHIGETFEMNGKIHKGFDSEANPILDLKALMKALIDFKEKVEFT
jgi:hypothetical protein